MTMIENRYSIRSLLQILGSLRIVDPYGTVGVHDIIVDNIPVTWRYRVSSTDELLDALDRIRDGETIYLEPGTYSIGETIVIDRDSAGIVGGRDTVLVFSDDVGEAVMLKGYGSFLYGVSIRKNKVGGFGVVLSPKEPGRPGYGQTVLGTDIRGFATGVRVTGSMNSVVVANNISSENGVSIDNSAQTLVALNTMGAYRQGEGIGVMTLYSQSVHIEKNYIIGFQYMVVLESSYMVCVLYNNMSGGSTPPSAYILLRSAYGFTPQPPTAYSRIVGNTCHSPEGVLPQRGIYEAVGDHNMILDNIVDAVEKIVVTGDNTVYNVW